MRLINWNIERRGPLKWQAASIANEISSLSPDLVVLTEAHADSLDLMGGHTLSHPGYNAFRKSDSEQLVVLWSKAPWEEIPLPDVLQENGGALLGRTELPGGEVYVLGLCIPWHMSPGIQPQEQVAPWAQHKLFLRQLKNEMPNLLKRRPLIVAGDFNRRIPSDWGSKEAYSQLTDVFSKLDIVTQGPLVPLGLPTIDHVALSGSIIAQSVRGLSRFDANGRARSDHFGVLVDMEWK